MVQLTRVLARVPVIKFRKGGAGRPSAAPTGAPAAAPAAGVCLKLLSAIYFISHYIIIINRGCCHVTCLTIFLKLVLTS